jgi:PAS domain S-box-containing protein
VNSAAVDPGRKMDDSLQRAAAETRRLQNCISDLVGVLALPAVWAGCEPRQIAKILIDSLYGMLQLDFAYIRMTDVPAEAHVELARMRAGTRPQPSPQELGEILRRCLGDEPRSWTARSCRVFADDAIVAVPLQLGLHGEFGMLVTGSARPDFPRDHETVVLRSASNQAAIGLDGARRLTERKQVAEELDRRVAQRTSQLASANEELRLQAGLLQHLPVAAWTLAPDGTPDFVNQSWLEYTGQSSAYVQSQPEAWMTALHPDDRDIASRAFWKGVGSGRDFTFEVRFRRARDGAYRWHLNRAVAWYGADRNVQRFVGTSTDIEELKQSQEDLQRAEERTSLIIDTALDAVITMNAGGMITSWNGQAALMFGYSASEVIGQRMSEVVMPARYRSAHETGLRKFLLTGEGPILRRRIEVSAIRRDGAEFPAELQVVPMRLGHDWVFSAFIRDITESKVAEGKLRESEFKLREMTETIPEMLWSATPDGNLDYCNARMLDYTGLPVETIMGAGWGRLLHPDDVDQMTQAWMSCVSSGAPYRAEVRILRAADHSHRWCVISALPLRDREGRILKWHGTVVDMHDWKQAQEELRNTQAELAHVTRVMTMGALTASIAHEVNQPLAGIITNANTCLRMLAADPPNLVGARETLRRTIRDGNRASDVVARLRSLFSKKKPASEQLDLNEAAREVLTLSRSQLQTSRAVLRLEFDDDLPPIVGDRVQLQQVILNLILNAAEAMQEVDDRPRWLVVRTALVDDDHACLTVQDAGVGFDPQVAERLFQPFYTMKDGGMGIGLAVSRSIIESHHGRLWAEPNEGAGAKFSFTIPMRSRLEETPISALDV